MDAVKFLNSRRRTCDSYPGCNGCEWKGKSCPGYVTYAPFPATEYERVKPWENVVKKEGAEKEMDAVKFLEERKRMYESGAATPSIRLEDNYTPERAVKIVEEWSAAHPRKTRQSVLLEQWPETKVDDAGTILVMPCTLLPSLCCSSYCGGHENCSVCRREFWMQEVE